VHSSSVARIASPSVWWLQLPSTRLGGDPFGWKPFSSPEFPPLWVGNSWISPSVHDSMSQKRAPVVNAFHDRSPHAVKKALPSSVQSLG
jgi:hypothetical protein